jgi:hypothetical protein
VATTCRPFGTNFAPGRYVGAEEVEDDGVPLAEKMEGLTRELANRFHESEKLQAAIRDIGSSRRHCRCRVLACKEQAKTKIPVSHNWRLTQSYFTFGKVA